ncbi:hypothetical protein THRCLA_20450 [Thraustotheca clavata]|uniref:Uncharacterized protein n=1 Tax=Thraustotheca clavata TaxID=74557 RepID=A0A1W0A702_9STRA|nr:hypothetical protein THRCLA_20450 [Thraustotheca clavata]
MVTAAEIEAALIDGLNATYVQVEDDSDGCGSKFSVIVVSSLFEGMGLLQRQRADSKVVSIIRERMLLDVVDQAWMQDYLSDDEIELPMGLEMNNEDGTPPLALPVFPGLRTDQPERWNDLGLSLFGRE